MEHCLVDISKNIVIHEKDNKLQWGGRRRTKSRRRFVVERPFLLPNKSRDHFGSSNEGARLSLRWAVILEQISLCLANSNQSKSVLSILVILCWKYYFYFQNQKEKDGGSWRRASEEARGGRKEGQKRRDRSNSWVYISGTRFSSNKQITMIGCMFSLLLFGRLWPS